MADHVFGWEIACQANNAEQSLAGLQNVLIQFNQQVTHSQTIFPQYVNGVDQAAQSVDNLASSFGKFIAI